MKRLLLVLGLAVLVLLFSDSPVKTTAFSPPVGPTPPAAAQPGDPPEVEKAILEAVTAEPGYALVSQIYQTEVKNLVTSADQRWSSAWLVLTDPISGETLPSEPGLAIVQRVGSSNRVFLPVTPGWLEALQALPEDAIDPGERQQWLDTYEFNLASMPTGPLTGYFLPWEGGRTVWLSRSLAHDADFPSLSAHYSFDFYISGQMWDIYAAKDGTVWGFKDTVSNNVHGDVNYLVLEDTSTNPVTYQLYLHLAQGSIPPELKVKGARVIQGQIIGVADNTGASTGHHLHFQVQNKPPSGGYWALSLDMTFDDVDINGGRPRRHDNVYSDFAYCKTGTYSSPYGTLYLNDVCQTGRPSYVSGNKQRSEFNPPAGALASPATAEVVESARLLLAGWGEDFESGLNSAQFVAYYAGAWRDIGPAFTSSPFTYEWDLCAAGVPDGPVSVAARLRDKVGNVNRLAGLQHFTKNYTCQTTPPPDCTPGPDQVAFFEDPDYTGGCKIFDAGSYNSVPTVGNDDVSSVRVGSNAVVTLYADASFRERSETLLANESSLVDNRIGDDSVSSFRVLSRNLPPAVPVPAWPLPGAVIPSTRSFSLSWTDGGGATRFQTRINGEASSFTSDWLADPWQHPSGLPDGKYVWQVRAGNAAGESGWSPYTQTLTLGAASLPSAAPVSLPYTITWESGAGGWTGTGLWNLAERDDRYQGKTHTWWFGESNNGDERYFSARTGDLTSPPILIPAGSLPPNSAYQLTFWYLYQTETSGRHWDQRWLQISVDNGPFSNLLQLTEDAQTAWLRSAAIDLSPYAGKTVRLRFHFDTIDGLKNDYEGWYVDDLEIQAAERQSCPADGEPNNTPAQSIPLAYGAPVTGLVCPRGDQDYFSFSGQAGDLLVVDIDAQVTGSALDSLVDLIDSDGTSILATNDDEVAGERIDSLLTYQLTRTGTYFLKLQSWGHPGEGGENQFYTLRLLRDQADPSAQFLYPLGESVMSSRPLTVTVAAEDSGSGISRVEFLWHTADWLLGSWTTLGTDSDGSDGWSWRFTSPGDQDGAAFYAKVYDLAGNWIGTGTWNLRFDGTPPVSALQPLAGTQLSTAVVLRWTASDALSGLDYYDLQISKGGVWQNYPANPEANDRSLVVVGEVGGQYGFRLRGVDRAGNAEAFPTSAETSTQIANDLCAKADSWEGDNTPGKAPLATVNVSPQLHTFCNPASDSSGLNDEDWVRFVAQNGKGYVIEAIPVDERAAAELTLFSSDGVALTELSSAAAAEFGKDANLVWIAPTSGTYFLRVRHIDSRVAGEPVSYLLAVSEGSRTLFPVMYR